MRHHLDPLHVPGLPNRDLAQAAAHLGRALGTQTARPPTREDTGASTTRWVHRLTVGTRELARGMTRFYQSATASGRLYGIPDALTERTPRPARVPGFQGRALRPVDHRHTRALAGAITRLDATTRHATLTADIALPDATTPDRLARALVATTMPARGQTPTRTPSPQPTAPRSTRPHHPPELDR